VGRKTCFSILIGPSGSGKSYIVRKLCNQFSHGVLYFEIKEPENFAIWLAEEVGMKLAPRNLMDLALGYVSKKYVTHYDLESKSHPNKIDVVFGALEDAAIKYRRIHGKVPVIVIDGVDLVAKHDEHTIHWLLTHAKVLANDVLLKIVLVSSEGNIVPILNKYSYLNRSETLENR